MSAADRKVASRYEQELLAQVVVCLHRTRNLVATKWTQLWSKDLYDVSYTLVGAIDAVTDTIDFDLVDEVRKRIFLELVTELGSVPMSYDENRSLLIAHNEAVLVERASLLRTIDSTIERLAQELEAVA